MAREKLSADLHKEFKAFLDRQEDAREATNAVNRQKTVLRNIFKNGIQNRQFLLGTYVLVDGVRFDYSVNETSAIPAEDFLKLYEDGDITREQFLKCVSVSKSAVDIHVGSDVTLQLSQIKEGKSFDVRVTTLDIDEPKETVMVTPAVSQPVVRKRKAKPTQTVKASKPRIKRVRANNQK